MDDGVSADAADGRWIGLWHEILCGGEIVECGGAKHIFWRVGVYADAMADPNSGTHAGADSDTTAHAVADTDTLAGIHAGRQCVGMVETIPGPDRKLMLWAMT
jgi:hypothetical protein